MKMRSFMLLGCFGVSMLSGVGAAQPPTVEDRMAWFQDAKFGMFIHFGVDNKSEFNPTDFDAGEWARIAKAAGMKYIVLTTKHHVGFCLWDSALTDWNVVDQTPFKRDIVKELAAACEAEGLEFAAAHRVDGFFERQDLRSERGIVRDAGEQRALATARAAGERDNGRGRSVGHETGLPS